MTLAELFKIVYDEQEVDLHGDGFDEVKGFKSTLEAVLAKNVLDMRVDCVEPLGCKLRVWVKA